jgi:hypothetical protein
VKASSDALGSNAATPAVPQKRFEFGPGSAGRDAYGIN